VGFVFDTRLSWDAMITQLCSKARSRLGALFRMCGVLDCENKALMYKAFVRSVMEYGCLQYMSASQVHIAKLDTVQRMAERICGCNFEPLEGRRRAAAFGLTCKLLDGECRGGLQDFKPEVVVQSGGGRTRGEAAQQIKITPNTTTQSLNSFKRSFRGSVHHVFAEVPQDIIKTGMEDGWRKVMKNGQRMLSGRNKI
jgi:hypothetical protein